MHFTGRRSQAALALLAAASLTAGCGGSGGGKQSTQIRGVDAATNGQSVTVVVNGASAFTTLTLDSPPTQYLYVETNNPSTFAYTSFNIPTDNSTPISLFPANGVASQTTASLNTNGFYTIFVIGRPDLVTAVPPQTVANPPPIVAPTPATSNPHAMQDVVLSDAVSAPGSGKSNLRILDAAPDAGNVDVLLDGVKIASNLTFAGHMDYQVVASGTHTVQVNLAGTATPLNSTATVPGQPSESVTFTDGKSDTLIVTEPTAPPISLSTTPLTYGIKTFED